jgi:chromosome segregation ATPase
VRQLRDEIDVLNERANKVQMLELELQCYKDRISQMESLKLRLEEAKDENKILQETKEMLEEQLERSGKFRQHIMSLETELFRCKSELNNAQVSWDNTMSTSTYAHTMPDVIFRSYVKPFKYIQESNRESVDGH